MKTIKIFLASSEELENDRNAFGNLIRRLDNIYEKRGIRIIMSPWEDQDAAYNDRRKQDEYNDIVRASDIFLAIFHTRAGKFTIEEFDVATEAFNRKASPKTYVYCKDLQPGEIESPELIEFKRRLFDEMGHYWCRYGNRDTMQLHFVMQLQLFESNRMDELKVEENGNVILDGFAIARMDQLPFAADNEAYQKMSEELLFLPDKIEKARKRAKKYPDDQDLKDDLQAILNRYNQLKEEFAKLQQALFDTAKLITRLQQEQVNARLQRAIEAFETGQLEHANVLLDEIAHGAEWHMERLDQDRALVHQDIEAFQLQAKTLMADVSIPIGDRITRVAAIYAKADDWAERSAYNRRNHVHLLYDYTKFLYEYGCFDNAIEVCSRHIALSEQLYGIEYPDTATSYNNIGMIYCDLGNYDKALECCRKALDIYESVMGKDHHHTATAYNNIGLVYCKLGDNEKALEYYGKSLDIDEKVLGFDHPSTARDYNNIGLVYDSLGNYDKALEYCSKGLSIVETVLGADHPDTAQFYNSIGAVYDDMGDNEKALECYCKALDIRVRILGENHPDTATSYNNIGFVYDSLGCYDKALEYYGKAHSIVEKVFGVEHPITAVSYNNIGMAYSSLGRYGKALECCGKALEIDEKVLGTDHPSTARDYNNIGSIYDCLNDCKNALEYYCKALSIDENVLGVDHPNTATDYNNIGVVYYSLGDCDKALEFYEKALAILEHILPEDHPRIKNVRKNIDLLKEVKNNGGGSS